MSDNELYPQNSAAWSGRVCTADNHGDPVLLALRTRAAMRYATYRHGDQSLGYVPVGDGRYVVLSWYKERHATEGAWVVDEGRVSPLDFDTADLALRWVGP